MTERSVMNKLLMPHRLISELIKDEGMFRNRHNLCILSGILMIASTKFIGSNFCDNCVSTVIVFFLLMRIIEAEFYKIENHM